MSTAIRLAISLIMAAAPEESLASDEPEAPRAAKSEPESYEERFPAAKAMIDDDIDKIARSPWGGTTEGKEIVRRLRRLSAEGNIKYGDTPEARGSFGGKDILVSEDYYGKMCQTILELVHEGSHANWRDWHKRHGPRTGKKSTDRIEEYKEEELHAVKNQLVIYRWLKTKFRSFTDSQLETRLKQEAANTLRDAIEQGIQSGKSKH